MDITDLEVFLAVAETQSFSRAAEAIYLTQPAISKRIAGLEAQLEQPLFDRIGRRVQLTEAGKALLPRAHSILNEIEDTRRALNRLTDTVSGPLLMATSHHIGMHRLPPALKHFHQTYNDIALDLRFMDSEAACAAVLRGDLEIAVVTLPEDNEPLLMQKKVWHDPLEIVVSRDHPLQQQTTVTRKDLLHHPAILPGPHTVTRKKVFDAFGRDQGKLNVHMATNYMEVLKMLASIGLGWTALPHTMIDEDLVVVHADNISISRELGIVTHRKRTLSNAARAMINIINEERSKEPG